MKSESFKIVFGYILISIIWGSTWLAIRFGLESLTPIFSGGARFFLASIFIYIIMRAKGLKPQHDKLSIILYLVMAFFSFVFPFGMVYWAEQYIPSGLTSVLFASFPFFVIIFSLFLLKRTVDLFQILGSIVGFGGIIVIFAEDISFDFGQSEIAMLVVLASAAIQGGVAVVIKKWGGKLHPFTMNFYPLLIAGIFMTASGYFFEEYSALKFNPSAIISISYLALFGTIVTFTVYYWLMKKINVVILSLTSFITPIIALILGWIFAGEIFTSQNLEGSALVLIGILFANLKGLIKYFKLKKI